MGLLYIWNRNLKEKLNMLTKVKFQVARKYPMWVFKTTTIKAKQSRKRSEVPIPRNRPKTVQICTPEHSDQKDVRYG